MLYGRRLILNKIENEDLKKIKGGFEVNAWIVLGIAAIIVFASGVISGITNPERCINE